MITIIPSRNIVSNTLALGSKIHLQQPAACYKKLFCDFIARNKSFHEPWVYVSSDPLYFDQYLKRLKSGSSQGFFIFTNDDRQFVGVINLNNIKLEPFGSASLGYYSEQSLCRNGYMKEAIRLVLGHAFNNIGLNRVEINVQPKNVASLELAKSLGFSYEGFSRKYLQINDDYRDHERWAFLAEDF